MLRPTGSRGIQAPERAPEAGSPRSAGHLVSRLHSFRPMPSPLSEKHLAPLLAVAALLVAAPAFAQPMDLSDTTARWVSVRFEVSPEDRPGQVRGRFSRRFLARLEPGTDEATVRVTVAAPIVEQHLLTGQEPAPGTFSDFVWTFDRGTGHVVSARTTGVLLRELGWGFTRWKTDAEVEVAMDTFDPVGFRQSRLMGAPYPRLCAEPDDGRCTVVYPARYDGQTGYVNAVGQVTARSGGLEVKSFSPLGEAMFAEIDDPFDTIWSRGEGALHTGVAAPAP